MRIRQRMQSLPVTKSTSEMATMAWLLLLVAIARATAFKAPQSGEGEPCADRHELAAHFRRAHFHFAIELYKAAAVHGRETRGLSSPHFAFSGNNMWLTLAAVAEGSVGEARQQLLHALNLPEEECRRRAFYRMALRRDRSNAHVEFDQNRLLAVDERLRLDDHWRRTATTSHGLEVTRVPLKSNPAKAVLAMRRAVSSGLERLNLTGSSVLLNSLDFEGPWTTAFPDSVMEKVPFHDGFGEHTGYVDMMKTKLYVRMGYVKSIESKVIELPIGESGRYRVMMALSLNETGLSDMIADMTPGLLAECLEAFRQSRVPVEVALPRFTIDTEYDAREVLESVGVKAPWRNPSDTCKIAKPSAFPTGYAQRASLTLGTAGVHAVQEAPEQEALQPDCDPSTGLHPAVGAAFVADRPFSFAVFDAQTYTSLVAGAYSVPTYRL